MGDSWSTYYEVNQYSSAKKVRRADKASGSLSRTKSSQPDACLLRTYRDDGIDIGEGLPTRELEAVRPGDALDGGYGLEGAFLDGRDKPIVAGDGVEAVTDARLLGEAPSGVVVAILLLEVAGEDHVQNSSAKGGQVLFNPPHDFADNGTL